MADVLDRRALNRATLARQHLLHRSEGTAEAAIEHLVGLQSQNPLPPYVGLWTRVRNFRAGDLAQLILDRRAVRMVVMRGTIHLVTAADALSLRPLVQPIMDRDLQTNALHRAGLAGLDLPALADAARELLDAEPRTPAQLGVALHERWPDRPPAALAHGARGLLPLVQLPPRGIWGSGGRTVVTTAQAWLGRPLDPDVSPRDVVLRYLAAFGPATAGDVQAWSGLAPLREVAHGLRSELRPFVDERGRDLLDLPDAPRPHRDTLAPVRFLPEFDNLLVAHSDRTRIISDADRKRIITKNGVVPGTVLVDGFARATWRLRDHGGAATVDVTPFAPLSKRHTAAVAAEGRRLLRFAAPDATDLDVPFVADG